VGRLARRRVVVQQ
jgi:hypothetical protein